MLKSRYRKWEQLPDDFNTPELDAFFKCVPVPERKPAGLPEDESSTNGPQLPKVFREKFLRGKIVENEAYSQ